ncbi:DNA polymerase IV, partial [Candidatus Saccharibacteria bacterium]|nr:DNA polymerase IV [Candidatus Saccharibacteria bacterium]
MRIIGHLDMDAFFAAIEERDNPQFAGLPIAVGADPKGGRGRGVVSTANYKARKYGIYSATPISHAWKLSQKAKKKGEPEVVFLPVNMKRYVEVSRKVMEVVRRLVPKAEQVSVDEAYFDLSFCGSYKKALKLCEKIKREIKEKEKLTASIGVGPNKLVAKIASDLKKPDGLTLVKESQVEDVLSPLSVSKIPGVGPKTAAKLKAMDISTIGELRKVTKQELAELFGKWGVDIFEKSRGRDSSPVLEVKPKAKSIGEQETFAEDTKDPGVIFSRLKSLSRDVIRRFHDSEFRNFRTVTVTVRLSGFETRTRSRTLEKPASSLAT